MKRLIACASLVAAASTAALSATPPKTAPSAHAPAAAAKSPAAKTPAKGKQVAKAAPRCKVAPADEYFGKLKMSILGIRNTIKDQGLKADYEPEKASSALNAIALTEDAMRDWQHKYPCDSWIPGTIFALEHFYTKIHTADGVKHVHATFAWLRHDFPRHRLVAVAMREDGQAVVVSPPVASAPAGAGTLGAPSATAAPAAPASAQQQPPIQPGGTLATPVPGTVPASAINAQNATGASPAPTASH